MNPQELGQRDLRSRALWFKRARPVDYVMAVTESSAALPVVGKHLEPLGMLIGMGAWGYRHVPNFLSSVVRSLFGSRESELREQDRARTHEVSAAALHGIVSPDRLKIDWPPPDRLPPALRYHQRRRHYLHRTSVPYGDAPEQHLDVWRRSDLPAGPAPVLVFVPGGGWVYGRRTGQGYALLSHLAEQGWVCLSIDYRVSPHHRWPRHIHDVKAAVAWARANVEQFGGDRDFVAIAGCSSGGHLAALTGLTADDPRFHTDLPADANTSVDAVVGLYGRYDWEDRSSRGRDLFMGFLENVVVRKRYDRHPEVFRAASPIARVRPDAPPYLVVHGSADSLIPVEQARAFVDRMRATSRSCVGYLELPGGGHCFDMIDGARTASAATAIGLFLNEIRRSHELSRPKQVV
jgi:acetyl esterase/lipase